MAEVAAFVKPKPRPIIRIGLFLISQSLLVSIICCVAGVLALLLLPVLAKNTYISENALMPGSASPMLSSADASDGHIFLNKIMSMDSTSTNTGTEIPEMIGKHIIESGGEVNYHQIQPISDNFHPLQFFLGPDVGIVQENYSCTSYGINTVGIVRAPRGDGKEAIVILTPYNSVKTTTSEALSLGVAYSVFSLLSRVSWLAKDIIWLAADSRHGEHAAVAAWLRDYYALSRGDLEKNQDMCVASSVLGHELTSVQRNGVSNGFRRAGTMAAALVIKVADSSTGFEKDGLKIYAEASNGQMPNLDLINIVNYLAVHGQGLQVRVEKIWSLLDSWWLYSLGELQELLGKVAKSLNPDWKFGIPASDYVEGCATLASSLYNQALGVPTGPHGAFRDFQVDSITLEFSPRFSSSQRVLFLLHVGRLVEGVIRSVNNLLEKFHQSFFLYLMTSPSRFVSVGVYMIAFALLIAPLPLVAAALFSDKLKSGKDDVSLEPSHPGESFPTFTAWNWLHTAKTVLIVHLWGAIVTIIPYFLSQFPNSSPLTNLSMWIASSLVGLFFTCAASGSLSISRASQLQIREWTLLKAVTVTAAFIGLCLMSVINYATAQIGALLLVPMCLMAVPLRIDMADKTMKALLRGACNILLVFAGFPPTAFLMMRGALDSFERVRIDDFWNWTESLRAWNSATYIYICMVHLPCWVLCIRILLLRR
ncbi:glycosylphosphatidylinositol anchor attachment 1 protein-like isoform X1 [Salvia splendens]|nr:glycosylphosphatidylinositol anchor attachment 1 protein-like isoform X1 [Salvia splendens]XP_042001444.1 glycosylphosphatidylinositol anchor attachment 1 protein-like isoform X1 [Salvia splendens]XP_042001445.1 glycosylphosphatidylinositol anchor attachment 1 protein-like isoform X1 [Salvia splendens]